MNWKAPESATTTNLKKVSISTLVALLAKSSTSQESKGDVQKEFQRRFYGPLKLLTRDNPRRIRGVDLEKTFARFHGQAENFNWPAPLEPHKEVLGWIFEPIEKEVPLSWLVELWAKVKCDPDISVSLVTLLARDENQQHLSAEAREKVNRRFYNRLKQLAQLHTKQIRGVDLENAFLRFYSEVANFQWPANLKPHDAVLRWMFESVVKEVPPASLVELLINVKDHPDFFVMVQNEFACRFRNKIKAKFKHWEPLDVSCQMDISIDKTFNNFYEMAGGSKRIEVGGSEKSITSWLFENVIKAVPVTALIFLLRNREADLVLADKAHKELYRRYYHRIQGKWKNWNFKSAKYDLDLWTAEAFYVFYINLLPKIKIPEDRNPVIVERRILSFLIRTFRRQVWDNRRLERELDSDGTGSKAYHRLYGIVDDTGLNRSHKKRDPASDNNEPKGPSVRDKQVIIALERLRLIKENTNEKRPLLGFLETLNVESRTILLVSLRYYSPYSGRCEMPEKTQDEICKELKISKKSLIERRSRLIKKVIDFIHGLEIPKPLSEEEKQARTAEHARAIEDLYKQGRRDDPKPIEIKPHPKAIDPEVVRKYAPRGPW